MLSWLPMFPYRESHLVVFDNGPPRESLPNWFLVRHRPSISSVRNKHLRTVRLGGLHMADEKNQGQGSEQQKQRQQPGQGQGQGQGEGQGQGQGQGQSDEERRRNPGTEQQDEGQNKERKQA